jgi:hypothetical protein
MDVVSLCPLRVASLPWQPRPGAWALTVICKATYELAPVESRLAKDQEYPNEDDNHWNDDPARSLYSPSDLAPFKPRADVLLVGHAFAPNHEPVRSLVARLCAGSVDKSIEVFGERSWTAEGFVREGLPFVKVPLRYERAAGGPDTDNPVGMIADDAAGAPIPNLQLRGAALARRGAPLAPAGFGPIAASWPGRAAKLGRRAATFVTGAWSDGPLPEDLDASFFNAAPPDQQTERLGEGERIVLENLSAHFPGLVTHLPGVRPRAVVDRGGALEEIALAADTLWIDTDRSRCTLTWRGRVAIDHPGAEGRVWVLMEEAARPLTWAEVVERCRVRLPTPSRPEIERDDTQRVRTQAVRIDHARQARPGADPDLPFVAAARGPSDAEVGDDLTATELPAEIDASPRWLAPAPPLSASSLPSPPIALLSTGGGWTLGGAVEPPPPIPPPAPPPPPLSIPLGSGAVDPVSGGVLAISNAAAGAEGRPVIAVPEPRPSISMPEPPPPRAPPAEIVDLLWFDPAALPRVRACAPWGEILAPLQPRPPEIHYDDEEPPPEDPQEVKDERDVFGILTGAEPAGEAGIEAAIAGAVSDTGAFKPPLVLAAGELTLPFDEIETLKATVSAVSPLAAGDRKLKEIVATVNELFQTQWLMGSSGVAESLTAKVKEAFAQSARLLPAGYLEAHTDRILLEQRHHQKRSVFGGTWIRALLTPPGATAPIPTYLPEALSKKLPMFQRLKVRLIAEAHLSQDQYEAHPSALRVVALGRVAAAPKGRR